MHVYIAGPMAGYKDWNAAMFDDAAVRWRARGHDVTNPAELDRQIGLGKREDIGQRTIRDIVLRDIAAMMHCDAVAVLPGWEQSWGARAEVAVAQWAGLEIYDAVTCELLAGVRKNLPGKPPTSILDDAKEACYGDRLHAYGHPMEDYKRVADLFGIMTGHKLTVDQAITFMLCVKLSREAHRHNRDNLVDLAGYADCLQRVYDRMDEDARG